MYQIKFLKKIYVCLFVRILYSNYVSIFQIRQNHQSQIRHRHPHDRKGRHIRRDDRHNRRGARVRVRSRGGAPHTPRVQPTQKQLFKWCNIFCITFTIFV